MHEWKAIDMKRMGIATIVSLCLVSALALAYNVSAAERTIAPDSSYSVEVQISFLGFCDYSWSSDVPLTLTVKDPNGYEYPYEVDSYGGTGTLVGYTSGEYTMTWANDGPTNAHLSFDLSRAYNEVGVEDAISAFMWAMIIIGIIIVAVVVIVVIVVVMGGRRRQAQPMMGPPPQVAAQAIATGHCPTCGNLLDPNASFCSKCGTRYR